MPKRLVEDKSAYPPGVIIFPNDQMAKFKEYVEIYKNASDKQILAELVKVKGQVSKEVLNQHVKNFDALTQMEGILDEKHKQRASVIRNILTSETIAPRPGNSEKLEVETQLWYGSSLLFWFLTLAALWGRGYYNY